MKKLGLDLGNRTLGIAISDDLGFLARGLETYRFEDSEFDKPLHYTKELVKKYNIDVVVLGHPKNMDGSAGIQAQIAENFKENLEQDNIKVVLWDERLTSKMATQMMVSQNLKKKNRKKDIDKMAATIILQGYLDSL